MTINPRKEPNILREILEAESEDMAPYNIDNFRKYCWTNLQGENIEFWLAAERFRQCCIQGTISKPNIYIAEVREMMKTYILPGSSFQVNLPQTLVTSMQSDFEASLRIRQIDDKLFEPAQEHVYKIMSESIFTNYLKYVVTQRRVSEVEEEVLWFRKPQWPSLGEFISMRKVENRADQRVCDLCTAIMLGLLLATAVVYKVPYLYYYLMLGFGFRALFGNRVDPQAIAVVLFLRPLVQNIFFGYPKNDFLSTHPYRGSEFICLLWTIGAFLFHVYDFYNAEIGIISFLLSICTLSALFDVSAVRFMQWYVTRHQEKEIV